jgi:hypothetical protein
MQLIHGGLPSLSSITSYLLQKLFSLHVSRLGFTHEFDIGMDGSQVIAEVM